MEVIRLSSSNAPLSLVVLISGRGSNLGAIVHQCQQHRIPAKISTVISNNPDAPGLRIAQQAGIAIRVIDHREYANRDEYDLALMKAIDETAPGLVVMAGFMRILSANFVRHYASRLINIHPSLLPNLRGLNTHARALAAGVERHGASVHFVTEELDAGPIIVQAAVPVLEADTPESLAQRVLEQEHRIYPLAISWFAQGRLQIHGDQVLLDGKQQPEQGLGTAKKKAYSPQPLSS